MKKKFMAALLGAAMGLGMYAAPADAHGVFYANRVDTKALVLGEGPLDNAYDPACVQRIDAYDVNFQPTTVERVDGEKNISIVPGEDLGVTATFFDYGYFAKTTDGKVIPTRDFSGIENLKAVTYAYKYNVHYWNEAVKPAGIYNVPIQIVPEVNPLTRMCLATSPMRCRRMRTAKSLCALQTTGSMSSVSRSDSRRTIRS